MRPDRGVHSKLNPASAVGRISEFKPIPIFSVFYRYLNFYFHKSSLNESDNSAQSVGMYSLANILVYTILQSSDSYLYT